MIRVALINHSFPSREHPYITDWVNQLYATGIDITILAEAVDRTASAPSDSLRNRVVLLNDLKAPARVLRSGHAMFQFAFRRYMLTALHAEHPAKKRSVVRKFYEYLSLRSESFDIVHFNAPQIAIRRFELGRILGGKTLVSFRGQDFTFHPSRYDRLLKEADHLHFISRHLLEEAHKRGYAGANYSIIPPLVDTEFYHPPAERDLPPKSWSSFYVRIGPTRRQAGWQENAIARKKSLRCYAR